MVDSVLCRSFSTGGAGSGTSCPACLASVGVNFSLSRRRRSDRGRAASSRLRALLTSPYAESLVENDDRGPDPDPLPEPEPPRTFPEPSAEHEESAPPAASAASEPFVGAGPGPDAPPFNTVPESVRPVGPRARTGSRRDWSYLLGRLDPGLPGTRALAIVGLIAALIAAGYLWRSRPVPQEAPKAARATVTTPQMPGTDSPVSPGAPPSGSYAVHVAGKVRRPGIVTVPAGSRVADAVNAAGGAKPGADTSTVNLARRVVDGEQILVGVPGASAAGAAGASTLAPGAPGSAQLDLNTATVEQLQQLPGVGPVLAQRMADFRTQHGGFQSVDQLRAVTGIGERRFAELKDQVRV